MVQFDNQYRQIKIKIVYYGPALGGKTTCLQHVHRVTDPQRRTKLYSLNTASDRTLFFDLLSLNLGRIRGYRLAMQLYTVPGQVQYNATRRAVLSGADGLVFVADSQADQREANKESLENLWENLLANGLDQATIPLVFLYNKRDLSGLLSTTEMDADLNGRGDRAFPSVAITGDGVMEAFAAVSERTLAAVADRLGVGSNPAAVERLQEQVRSSLQAYMPHAGTEPADDVAVVHHQHIKTPDEPLSEEALVGEAVRANMAMTDLNTRLDTLRSQLERKVNVMGGIADFGRAMAAEHDPAAVLRLLLATTVRLLQVQAAAILVVPGSGQLKEATVHGVQRDPLLATPDEAGEPIAVSVVSDREPVLLAPESGNDGGFRLAAVESAGFTSALVVPMVAQERIVGLLTCYSNRERLALDEDDLQLACVLGGAGAMGYAHAVSWSRLEEFNRGLEGQVVARTAELQQSLEEKEQLANDLREKNRLLEGAYSELSQLDRVKDELITRISQELKTPVTSLVTAAKILDRSRHEPPEKTGRFVTIIHEEAQKLSEIIQSVFQASVLAASQQAFECEQVPAEDLFRRAISHLRDVAQQREVGLHVLIPSGLDAVSCDPSTLEAALRAVIKNAIEFNHKGGEVKVEVRRVTRGADPWLLVKVSDTGVGISEQEIPHVFETFWQGGNVLGGQPRGVGLGLSIAKRVAEAHGGTVTLASEVAKGTEVTLAIPQ